GGSHGQTSLKGFAHTLWWAGMCSEVSLRTTAHGDAPGDVLRSAAPQPHQAYRKNLADILQMGRKVIELLLASRVHWRCAREIMAVESGTAAGRLSLDG
ncbi:MAG: hypothetical protein JWP30_1325, partial [Homoserinimonas sp.]|nr:hypothetical protein [Homoserinimonas sp.]